MGVTLSFERDYEFAPIIVWDALVQADLVSGWLAEATITPEVGGEYNLQWVSKVGRPTVPGRITVMQPLERLHVDTSALSLLKFDLEEVAGGSRGTSTRLRLVIDLEMEPAFAAGVKADWMTNLDQLDDLLRGHPVDWAHWDRDRHDDWSKHYDEAADPTS